MVHRDLGMTDEEKQKLEQHLVDGGVTQAVMAHEDLAAAAESVPSALCDEVNSCALDPAAWDQQQAASSVSTE